MKKRLSKLVIGCVSLVLGVAFLNAVRPQQTYAATTTTSTITDTVATTEEPEGSDLTLVQAETKLDSTRWIQSYCKDGTYYYFVQMTNPTKGHLRITRVKYTGNGIYLKDHMDLKGFGHGTNIDCSVYNGRTYLWIGSSMKASDQRTQTISCFQYQKNKVLTKKAGNTYTIRMKGSLKRATNVFPAVSQDNKYLLVRYTYKKKQYFQKYKIYNGNKINSLKPLNKVQLSATTGDFQGFDVYNNYIYTIEGSPTALFLRGYDRTRKFYPTIIRITNMSTKSQRRVYIKGASTLLFREPEGIKVSSGGQQEIMFVSNTLTNQYCNLYLVK